jgi:aminoglycoside phosphotransferase (APT) family kinase protein
VQIGLAKAGVRVPRILAVCEDDSVLGVPFYVMEEVDGVVVTDALPPALEPLEERRRLGFELVDRLVELHAVDWEAHGLAIGKPTGYQAFALWKASVFCEAIYRRYLKGERADAWAGALCDGVPRLLDVAEATL